jgi:hypothetical protein
VAPIEWPLSRTAQIEWPQWEQLSHRLLMAVSGQPANSTHRLLSQHRWHSATIAKLGCYFRLRQVLGHKTVSFSEKSGNRKEQNTRWAKHFMLSVPFASPD